MSPFYALVWLAAKGTIARAVLQATLRRYVS